VQKKYLIVLLSLLVLSGFSQNSSEILIRANQASLERRYDEAAMLHRQFITLNKSDYRGYFNLGMVYFNAMRFDSAILTFSDAINLYKNHKESRYYRAKSYLAISQMHDAISDAHHLLSKDSSDISILLLLAEIYQTDKKYEKALQYINESERYDLNHKEIVFAKAYLLKEMGHLSEALRYFQKLYRLNSTFKKALYEIGFCYLQLDEIDTACIYFERALDNRIELARNLFEKYCNQQSDN